jgi:hypothetical protein
VLLVVAVFLPLVVHAPSTFAAVSLQQRSADDIYRRYDELKPVYSGTPYATTPSWTSPYVAGSLTPGFAADGLNILNFVRYVAGLPDDVVLDGTEQNKAMHGAVLLAASTFSHTPPKPADMSQSFYDIGLSSTSKSNIGYGYTNLVAFQLSCIDDDSAGNITRVGHRRWILNPPMAKTGMGFANGRTTTYAFDRSRTEAVDYSFVAWPPAGVMPVELFGSTVPWSVSLNPAKYDWTTGSHTVKLRRQNDGATWTFDATDTDTSGEYYNFDTAGYGISNSFIFRPNPSSVQYQPGDVFDVTISGGIYKQDTTTPVSVTYTTTFISLVNPIDLPENHYSIAGTNRYETAVKASQKSYASGAGTVVLATGENWPDALGGAALAGAVDGPLLLTQTGVLPASVLAEIKRLGAEDAYILGGTGAVSSAVEAELKKNLTGSVTRIAGSNRFSTANRVADEVIRRAGTDFSGEAFIATGENFPDALGASPLAASGCSPIVLTPRDARPYLPSKVKRAVILGGTAAVSAKTETVVRSSLGSGNVKRLGGANRYDTAAKVADYGVACGMCWNGVGIATGTSFPDALSGGAMLGSLDSVLLLTDPFKLSGPAQTRLAANKAAFESLYFIGGTDAVSLMVRGEVAQLLE